MYGSFYEWCTQAGSYRVALCGRMANNTQVFAIKQSPVLKLVAAKTYYENLGTISKSKEITCRIPIGALQADVKHALYNMKAEMVLSLSMSR